MSFGFLYSSLLFSSLKGVEVVALGLCCGGYYGLFADYEGWIVVLIRRGRL